MLCPPGKQQHHAKSGSRRPMCVYVYGGDYFWAVSEKWRAGQTNVMSCDGNAPACDKRPEPRRHRELSRIVTSGSKFRWALLEWIGHWRRREREKDGGKKRLTFRDRRRLGSGHLGAASRRRNAAVISPFRGRSFGDVCCIALGAGCASLEMSHDACETFVALTKEGGT